MATPLAGPPAPSSHILQPSTSSATNKPLAPAPGFSPISNHLGPTKEWTIPPRPKPGRKPALDAPPTKRKAQNREAQRAFRERRAAKVGELEDQMKQMEKEDMREQENLQSCVKDLQGEVDMWQRLAEHWRTQSDQLQAVLDRERQAKEHLEVELQILKDSIVGSTDAVPLRLRIHRHAAVALEKSDQVSQDFEVVEDMTCGKCSNGANCQCIEDAFKMSDITAGTAGNDDLKRPLSPQRLRDSSKRVRPNECDDEQNEIDFTTRRLPALPNNASSSSMTATAATADSCGFCQDGTTCICAEIHRQNEKERRAQMTADESSASKDYELGSACTQNPGSCLQCQSIPASKNFCLSLAESRMSNIKNADSNLAKRSKAPTLKCADAFNQLAQHPAFPQASTQLQTWVPQLAARSVPSLPTSDTDNLQGRTAFEIEAAGVMNVLKLFDVRFGENGNKTKPEGRIRRTRDT